MTTVKLLVQVEENMCEDPHMSSLSKTKRTMWLQQSKRWRLIEKA